MLCSAILAIRWTFDFRLFPIINHGAVYKIEGEKVLMYKAMAHVRKY
jgi:hypothetical protein